MPQPSTAAHARHTRPGGARRLVTALVAGTVALGTPALVIAPGAGALPPGGAKSKSNGAKVTMRATSVKAGNQVRVSGSGWKSKGSRVQSGAQVTVKLDDGVIVAVFPIKGKKFSGFVTIPKQVKAGKHWLRFLASEPATSLRSHTFKVTK